MLDERGAKLIGLLLSPGPPVTFEEAFHTLERWRNNAMLVRLMHLGSPDRQGESTWFSDSGLIRELSVVQGLAVGNQDEFKRDSAPPIGLSFAQAFSMADRGSGLILVYPTGARCLLWPVRETPQFKPY